MGSPPRLLLAVLLGASAAPPAPPAIDRGLPWTFTVKPSKPLSRMDPFAASTSRASWTWKSTKPYERDESGKWFLYISLSRYDFDGEKAAAASLEALMKMADPHTGFSYSWDYVVLDGARAWHLNAPCLWSEPNFHKLTANLVSEALGGKTPADGQVIECHCGGPCARR